VWAILGVLAVYFAGARLIGRPAAAAGALLLTLNIVEVWFARYPNAEVVMQTLLFAALLANARAHVDGDGFFAPIAGALLGLLLFLRIDAAIAVLAVCAGIALGLVAGQRPRWTFWPPLAIAAALCAWYLAGPMRAYVELPRIFLTHFAPWQYGALATAVAAGIALIVLASRTRAISQRIVDWLPVALAAAVVALAIYALYFRAPAGKLAPYDAFALRTYASYYVTVPGVIAALVGYVLVVRWRFWRDPALLITIAAFALFFFYKIRIVAVHFWMARRFLPVILPGTLLLGAAAALTGVRGRVLLTRVIRGPVGVVFLALLASSYARAARPVLAHVEYAGVIPRLEQLAARVADNDLLIVESRDASDVHVLALPLAYIYAKSVLVLASAAPDKPTFGAFLEWARTRYRRVLFLGGGGTDLLSSRWDVAPVASERFQVPEYESTPDYPRVVRRKEFDYSLYAFTPPQPPHPFDLDVGINDDLNVIRFDAKEQTEGRTFRWSQDQSFIVVPRIGAADRTVAIWMSNGGRAASAPPADVSVAIGERTLGTVRVARGFAEYDFAIPPDVAARAAASGEPVRLVGVCLDLTERRRAEERHRLLAREVDHRAKNALAVVQAALRLTPKDDAATYARAVEGRVQALARVHGLLAEARWSGAELRSLATGELEPFLPPPSSASGPARAEAASPGLPPPRVELAGPPLRVGPSAAQALSMALHELATNATKHGALSVPGGVVRLSWAVDRAAGLLALTWTERGGPAVVGPPSRRGFGSRVIEGTVADQLGGHAECRWEAEGLTCEMRVPLARALAFGEKAADVAAGVAA
jgi:two-component sensor histidine kinase